MAIFELSSGPPTHRRLMRRSKHDLLRLLRECYELGGGMATYEQMGKWMKHQLAHEILEQRQAFQDMLTRIDTGY